MDEKERNDSEELDDPEELDETEEDEDDSGVDVERTSTEELRSLIKRKDRTGLTLVFDTVPNIDIAEEANDLTPEELIYIFHNVSSEYTADFFDDLSLETKENLIRAMTDKDLVKVINSQAADDVADTVGSMPANLASKVLIAADKDMRKDINALLKYKEDTAGSLMTTEYINLLDQTTVNEAISYLRERGKDAETIFTVFVRNASREFVGTVDLDDLIFAKPEEKLEDIMNRDVVSVSVDTDQEEVGRMFQRYDLNALAVLNDDDRIVGVITIDDAVDVMVEETDEDIARMNLMEPTERPYLETSVFENAKHCVPWIIALLILGTFTTMVLNRLESQAIFVSLPILISFIPTLMDTGGNAGGQTTGMMIRGLATREFTPKDLGKVLWKELRSAILIAACIAAFSFAWIAIEQYTGIVTLGVIEETNGTVYDFTSVNIWNGSAYQGELAGPFAAHAFTFAGLVSVTMFLAISFSKGFGTLLCMAASALKKDPALLAQPMLTTIMDVTTLLIYFGMACLFFPRLI